MGGARWRSKGVQAAITAEFGTKSRIAQEEPLVKLQFDVSFTIGRGGAQVESIG